MEIKGNNNAFGYGFTTADGSSHVESTGLSIRAYIATKAMQGLIANAPDGHLSNSKEGVELAVKWADDLITELNRK